MSNIKDSYVFVESKSQDQTCIGIKGGKFIGVIYKYGKVSLGEETEDVIRCHLNLSLTLLIITQY